MSLQKWKPPVQGTRADIYIPRRMHNPLIVEHMRFRGASSCPVFWAQYEGVYCELDHYLALQRLVNAAKECVELPQQVRHMLHEILERTPS